MWGCAVRGEAPDALCPLARDARHNALPERGVAPATGLFSAGLSAIKDDRRTAGAYLTVEAR